MKPSDLKAFSGTMAIWSGLHPEKTRLIEFGVRRQDREQRGEGSPKPLHSWLHALLREARSNGAFRCGNGEEAHGAKLQAIKASAPPMHEPVADVVHGYERF